MIFFVTLLSFTLACLCPFCSCKMHNRSTAIAGKTHFNIFSRGSQDMQSGTLGLVRRHQEAAENVRDLYSFRTSDFKTIHDTKPPMQSAKTIQRIPKKPFSTPKPSSPLEIWSVELTIKQATKHTAWERENHWPTPSSYPCVSIWRAESCSFIFACDPTKLA